MSQLFSIIQHSETPCGPLKVNQQVLATCYHLDYIRRELAQLLLLVVLYDFNSDPFKRFHKVGTVTLIYLGIIGGYDNNNNNNNNLFIN